MRLNHLSENRLYSLSGRMVKSQSAANFNIGGAADSQSAAKRAPAINALDLDR